MHSIRSSLKEDHVNKRTFVTKVSSKCRPYHHLVEEREGRPTLSRTDRQRQKVAQGGKARTAPVAAIETGSTARGAPPRESIMSQGVMAWHGVIAVAGA